MNKKLQSSIVPGVFFLVISLILWLITPNQVPTKETGSFTAQTFPHISLAIVIICSLGLVCSGLIQYVRDKKKKQASDDGSNTDTMQLRDVLRVLSVLALVVAGAIVGKLTGLLLAGMVLAIGMLIIYNDKKKHHYLIVAVIVVISYYAFKTLFGLNLP